MEKEKEEKKSDEVITRERDKVEGAYRSREPRGDGDDDDSDNDGDKKE